MVHYCISWEIRVELTARMIVMQRSPRPDIGGDGCEYWATLGLRVSAIEVASTMDNLLDNSPILRRSNLTTVDVANMDSRSYPFPYCRKTLADNEFVECCFAGHCSAHTGTTKL